MTTNWYEAPCARVSAEHAERAQARQAVLTKPAGSLGRLEQLAVGRQGLRRRDQLVGRGPELGRLLLQERDGAGDRPACGLGQRR